MAYRFKLSEAPEAGLRRIAREQAGRILTRLAGDAGDETTIHESRKALKRLKALFKLVRRALPDETYGREYRTIRDVAQALSGPRDLEVMPQTLAALGAAGGGLAKATVACVRAAIERRARATIANEAERGSLLASAAESIEAARARYAALHLDGDSFALLSNGAATGLGTLHRQHDLAIASGDDEAYHDWRKSAQLHWRHLRLLSEAWPAMIAARVTAAKCLADVLGHDHDLSVLGDFVVALPAKHLPAAKRRAFLDRIRTRQLALRMEARATAQLLLAGKPRKFAAQLDAYHAARCDIVRLGATLGDPFAAPVAD